ncbi:MAG: hypothetical protein MMC33_006015 [Icmadophila ericetorum]|nr:hypothetical protein [Icmadophila ericetorum]
MTSLPNGSTETTVLLSSTDDQEWNGGRTGYSSSTITSDENVFDGGESRTSWQHEAKILAKSSQTLILTYLLQYSLNVASMASVGHLGKIELGAASLASVTSNITGWGMYQGLSTALDTLCPQAYGSGKPKLVGLQFQRMVYFLWLATIPIAITWFFSADILLKLVPDHEVAILTGKYLKVLILATPAYATFEAGKRYVQAQDLFNSTLWVLLVCAPVNAFLNWLFVWKFQWGFIGSPIAMVVTINLEAFLLCLYVVLINGHQCWSGFSRQALKNWGPMIRLALPGLIMVQAELFGFELLTLLSSYFSNTHLAAQSVVSTIALVAWLIPFSISVAAGTRIGNLIGAIKPQSAKIAAAVSLGLACCSGTVLGTLIGSLRYQLPKIFTGDPDVIALAATVLPIVAAYQIFDSLAAICHGILRGLGRQKIGGIVGLVSWYVVGMPISLATGFGLGWELHGMWFGTAIALVLSTTVEALVIWKTSWQKVIEQAVKRNSID